MVRYISLPLFIGLVFWGCEESDEESGELKLIFSSVNDGEKLTANPSIFLKFSTNIPDETFKADSIQSHFSINVNDTTNFDGELSYAYPISLIINSDWIRINGVNQTFFYNSTNHSCVLTPFTTEFYPEGTGDGLSLIGFNQMMIGDEIITFEYDENYAMKVVPNPYIVNPFEGDETENSRRLRFTHLLNICFLDIYNADNSEFIIRLSHNNSESSNLWWDLKDNHGQEIESGFFTYVMGAYFSEDGSLIEVTRGYFIINKVIE